MRVLRVENKNGEGPYRAMMDCLPSGMYDSDIQPGPYRDGIDECSFSYPMLFGFVDDEQLLRWFNPHNSICWEQYKFMANHEYQIVEYHDVEEVINGYSQVIFKPTKNKKVILTITEFFR